MRCAACGHELGEKEDLALAFMMRANLAYRRGDLDVALSRGLQALEQTERNATPRLSFEFCAGRS